MCKRCWGIVGNVGLWRTGILCILDQLDELLWWKRTISTLAAHIARHMITRRLVIHTHAYVKFVHVQPECHPNEEMLVVPAHNLRFTHNLFLHHAVAGPNNRQDHLTCSSSWLSCFACCGNYGKSMYSLCSAEWLVTMTFLALCTTFAEWPTVGSIPAANYPPPSNTLKRSLEM